MKKFILIIMMLFLADGAIAQSLKRFHITGKIFTLQHNHKKKSGTEYRFYKIALGKNPVLVKENGEISIANMIIHDEKEQKTYLRISGENRRCQLHKYSHKEKQLHYDIRNFAFFWDDLNTQFIANVLVYELIANEHSGINKNLELCITKKTQEIYEIQMEDDSSNVYIISGISQAGNSVFQWEHIQDFPSQTMPEEILAKTSYTKLDIKGKQFKLTIPTKGRPLRYKIAISSKVSINKNNKTSGNSLNGIMISDYQTKKSYLASNAYFVCDKDKSNEMKHFTLVSYLKQLSDPAKIIVDVVLQGMLNHRFSVEKKEDQYIVRDNLGNQVQISEIGNAPEYIFRGEFLCDF
ncbi:MAG: hypothetical protein HUU50_17625 [Candidatus Brocadiae bacterium]|nr:hypothetical protein [Candidatus Brocadiia bacterium]